MGLTLWLLVYSRRAPNRGVFLATSAFLAGGLGLLNTFKPLGLEVSRLHPTGLIKNFYPEQSVEPGSGIHELPVWELCSYPISVSAVYLTVALVYFWLARLRFNYAQ
jgi:hypothetical protein